MSTTIDLWISLLLEPHRPNHAHTEISVALHPHHVLQLQAVVSLHRPLSQLAQEEVVETALQVREVFLRRPLDLVLALYRKVDLPLSHRVQQVQRGEYLMGCRVSVLLRPLHSVFAIRLLA